MSPAAIPRSASTLRLQRRPRNLCYHFEVDRHYIGYAAIAVLAVDGKMTDKNVIGAIREYRIDVERPDPIEVVRRIQNPPAMTP